MRNIALKIRYDGSRYHGWQVQKTEISVCQTVQEALSKICGHPVKVTGCGRTDADGYRYEVALLFRPAPIDGANGGLGLRAERAHGRKIMRALKGLGSPLHQLDIKARRVKAGSLFQERISDIAVIDFIDVLLFYAGGNGVELVRNLDGIEHRNVVRQARDCT